MTDNINVQIIEPPLNNLIIETQVGSEPINVSVVSYSGTNISIIHDLPILPSDINDNIASLLVAGSGIQINYNNNIPSITISSSGESFNPEQVQDIVGNLISGSGYATVNYNDNLNSLIIGVTGLQPSGNYSVVGHSHSSSDITDINSTVSGLLPVKNISSGSGISVTNNSGDFTVSVTGQFGLTSEQVDDRVNNLLVAGSYISLNYNDSLDTLSVSATGLQPSGNYSLIGHNHNINDISGLQIALDSKQPSGVYASGVHTHTINDITNFNSGVSGLLPHISGSQYISTNFNNNIYTISATGLQPSGNYSIIGHTHTSSEITDFNNSVNGLVSGVYAPLNSPSFSGVPTVPTASSGTNTNQIASTSFVRNEISNLVNSAPSTLDTLNELATALGNDPNFATTVASGLANKAPLVHSHTIADVSGLQTVLDNKQPSGVYASGVHSHLSSDITDFNSSVSGLLSITNVVGGTNISVSSSGSVYTVSVSGQLGLTGEQVDDRVNDLLKAGQYINLNYNDSLDSLTIGVTGLQPSGNYANAIHSHLSSDITDFITSVSGLLPVKDISAGTGISITSNSGVYTINSTGSGILADQASSIVTTVFNKTGSIIPKMTAVYINGGQGDLPTIALAIATGDITSAGTYGLTYESISNMSSGKAIVFGALNGLNTDQFNPTAPHGDVNGQVIYLSPSVSGGLTLNKPSAPNHIVTLGTIVRTHQNEGVIEVRVQNGFELEELHNVAISGVASGQFLQYNSASGLWVPSNSGNFTSLSVNSTGVSLSGHSHTVSNVTDFNSGVSGLLPVVSGSGQASSSFVNNVYTISVTGLQPSGNYSTVGHTHTSSNITDFNSSVSGLLPVTNILGGSNVSVSSSGSVYTVAVTGSLGLTTEEVDDRVSNLLVAGSGINLNYNDNANTLTISTINNIILSDVVDSTNYIGRAVAGTSTSSSFWRIKRTIYNSAGSVTSSTVANNVAWNDRLTASYS